MPPEKAEGAGHQGDARGGFGHAMMEQFEALRKQGYTVLLGEAGEAKPDHPDGRKSLEAQTRPGTVDYSKFDKLGDDDSDVEVDDEGRPNETAAKVEELGALERGEPTVD